MTGRIRRKPLNEEEKIFNLRVPARFLKKLDAYLETARPPLSRNTWIVEAMMREFERAKELEKKGK
jgi:hypothetical protein